MNAEEWRPAPGPRKLTASEVVLIRALHADKWLNARELGDEFGVTEGNIRHILARRSWKDVA